MQKNLKAAVEITNKVTNLADLRKLIDSLEQSGQNVDKLKHRSEQLAEEWSNLDTTEQSQRFRRLRESVEKTANATDKASRSTDTLRQRFKKLKDQGDASKPMRDGVNKTSKSISHLKTKITGIAAAITAAFATSAVARFFTSSVSGAANLEEQLDKVRAVSGATDEEMSRIAVTAEAMGASTKYTSTQAAEGIEILARAGLKASQAIETLPSVLSLAQASGLGLADTAGYITKAVAGMNLTVSDSGRVADVLAKAAASANTDVAGLGQALSYAAPSAASLGLSLEATVALIGKFADAGIDASRAGTALNSIFAQFANPASKFKQELAKLGITTTDFELALEQLAMAGEVGQAAILAVGQEAGPALKALLAQGIPSLNDLTSKLYNAQGAAQQMADTMSDNVPGAVKGLGSVWDTLRNNLGKPLLEPVKQQIYKLTDAIRNLANDSSLEVFSQRTAAAFVRISDKAINLVKNVDLSSLVERMSGFADNTEDAAARIGGGFGLVYNSLATGFSTIKSVITKVASVVAKASASMTEAQAKILEYVPGMEKTAKAYKRHAEGLYAVSDALAKESKQALDDATNAGERLQQSWDNVINGAETARQARQQQIAIEKQAQQATEDAINADIAAFNQKKQRLDELKNIQAAYATQTEKDHIREAQLITEITALESELAATVKNKTLEIIDANQRVAESQQETADKLVQMSNAANAGFAELGVDVNGVLTGISTGARTAMTAFTTSFKLAQQAGTENMAVTQAAIQAVLDKLKSPAEFAAFNQSLKSTGALAKATAEQQKQLAEGQKSTAEATKSAADAQELAATAVENIARATREATDASQKNADAVADNTKSLEKNAQASETAGSKSSGLASIIQGHQRSLSQSSLALEHYNEGMKQLVQNVQSMSSFIDGMNGVFGGAKQILERYKEEVTAVAEATDDLQQKTQDGTVSLYDIQQAAVLAETAMYDLNDAELTDLNASIDAAKQKLIDLKAQARKTAEELEAELARTKGDDSLAKQLEQKRKLAELEEKLADARTRQSNEEIEAYEKSIRLQRQIFEEKEKQRQQSERERQQKEQQRSQSNTSSKSGNATSLPPQNIGGDTGTLVLQMGEKNIPIPDVTRAVLDQIRRDARTSSSGVI